MSVLRWLVWLVVYVVILVAGVFALALLVNVCWSGGMWQWRLATVAETPGAGTMAVGLLILYVIALFVIGLAVLWYAVLIPIVAVWLLLFDAKAAGQQTQVWPWQNVVAKLALRKIKEL